MGNELSELREEYLLEQNVFFVEGKRVSEINIYFAALFLGK